LLQSHRVRVFHASGDADLEFHGVHPVVKEEIVEVR